MRQKNNVLEPATKNDLNLLENSLKGEINITRREHKQYKDEVMTKLDDISGQLENLQEDKDLSIHQTEELREQVNGHEGRIKRLEKTQQTV